MLQWCSYYKNFRSSCCCYVIFFFVIKANLYTSMTSSKMTNIFNVIIKLMINNFHTLYIYMKTSYKIKYLWFSGTGSINNFNFVIILHAFCVWVSSLCVLKLNNNNNNCKCLLLCALYANGLFCISPYVHFISVITTYLHLIIMFYIMFVVLMVTWHTFWYAVESACTVRAISISNILFWYKTSWSWPGLKILRSFHENVS